MRYLWTGLASIVLAILVWFYARSLDIETLARARVPVEFRLAGNNGRCRIEPPGQGGSYHVLVTFTGPRAEINRVRTRLNRDDLVATHRLESPPPDASAPQTLVVPITPADLAWFPGVTKTIVPGHDRVSVTVVPIAATRMKVELHLTPGAGDLVLRSQIEPLEVEVEGPKELLARHDRVLTERFDIAAAADSTEPTPLGPLDVPLEQTLEGQPVDVRPKTVRVKLMLSPRMKIRSVTDLPVRFLMPGDSRFKVKPQSVAPATVSVRVKGPVLQDLKPNEVKVFVDLTDRPLKTGLYPAETLVVHLPAGFQPVDEPPRIEKFELVAPANPLGAAGATVVSPP